MRSCVVGGVTAAGGGVGLRGWRLAVFMRMRLWSMAIGSKVGADPGLTYAPEIGVSPVSREPDFDLARPYAWPVPSDQARLYQRVLIGYVESGVAPHYVEIGRALGWPVDDARAVLHQVAGMGLSMWLHPGTDLIAACAPFSSVPTLYRISVDGASHGYAQCGLEALAVSWLFPHREVRIDALCPDCGDPISLAMREGRLLSISPERVVAHTNVPFSKWSGQLPLA